MGRKKAGTDESVPSDEVELAEETEEGDFEASVLREDGSARQQGGRRRGARGLEERETSELPDEPPPGYPG